MDLFLGTVDRVDRGDGAASQEQLELIHEGLSILSENDPNRAERVQLLFSREYSNEWRNEFGI